MAEDLDQLFRLYHRELQQIAYHRVGDRQMAADLAQDTFVRYAGLTHGATSPPAIDNPRFFLMRILRNLVIDRGRAVSRRGEHIALHEVDEYLLDPRAGPERQLELRRQLECLHLALNELPPLCREALLLNRLEGLSHQAIAVRQGVSASLVCKHIMRALRHCIRRLGLLDD